jgi:hypothetical protein
MEICFWVRDCGLPSTQKRAPASKGFNMRLACTFFVFSLAAIAQMRTLQDGTPVRLRLSRNVSSANAHVNETVDFEVTEPVINQNYVVIPKGAVALGRVTKVDAKRRFGRGGALELSIDSIRLTDGGTILLRASREKGEGGMSDARVAATVAAAPVLVWVKGKDVTFEKGTETTAYVSGDTRINESHPSTGTDQCRHCPDAESGPFRRDRFEQDRRLPSKLQYRHPGPDPIERSRRERQPHQRHGSKIRQPLNPGLTCALACGDESRRLGLRTLARSFGPFPTLLAPIPLVHRLFMCEILY